MKDWLRDDNSLAKLAGISVPEWRKIRAQLIGHGMLKAEQHPVEGPILRATHPEHIAAVGMMMGPRP